MGASDQITDPFTIVTDHHKCLTTTIPENHSSEQRAYRVVAASNGVSSTTNKSKYLNQAAADFFVNTGSGHICEGVGAEADNYSANPIGETVLSQDSSSKSLRMPVRLNPHDIGIRRSPCLSK